MCTTVCIVTVFAFSDGAGNKDGRYREKTKEEVHSIPE
jgi:hypothetical protein